jgi:hypothetical protein
MVDHVQIWGIRWQKCHMDVTTIEVFEQQGSFIIATEAIPNPLTADVSATGASAGRSRTCHRP